MKTLTADLILEKNKLASNSPWLVLFTVKINDTIGKVRYVDHPESIVFNGKTYIPFPIKFDTIKEEAKAGLFDLTMTISNVSRVIQGYLDNNELRGNKCNIKIVHKDHLGDSSAVIKERFEIVSWRSTLNEVQFVIGSLSLIGARFPSTVMLTDHCRHLYRGADGNCGYLDSTGAGTISSSGVTVTGVGTLFNTVVTFDPQLPDESQASPNASYVNPTFDSIKANGLSAEVLSVSSDTVLTLKKAFTSDIAPGTGWTRFRTACTLNLEGVNGCRSHGNDEIIHGMIDFTADPPEERRHPLRFGGFPSLVPGLQIV